MTDRSKPTWSDGTAQLFDSGYAEHIGLVKAFFVSIRQSNGVLLLATL